MAALTWQQLTAVAEDYEVPTGQPGPRHALVYMSGKDTNTWAGAFAQLCVCGVYGAPLAWWVACLVGALFHWRLPAATAATPAPAAHFKLSAIVCRPLWSQVWQPLAAL